MANIFIEHRKLEGEALTWDLAHHLFMRYMLGPVIIVGEKPVALLAALRKQWVRLVMKVRNEYSRTLSPVRRRIIQEIVHQMENLPFILDTPPPGSPQPRAVYIVTPAQINAFSDDGYFTVYTTCIIVDSEKLEQCLVNRGALIKYVDDQSQGRP